MICEISCAPLGTVKVDLNNPLADIRLHRQIKELSAEQQRDLLASVASLLQLISDVCEDQPGR